MMKCLTVALALLTVTATTGCLCATEIDENNSPIASPAESHFTSATKNVYHGLILEMTGDDRRPVNVWNSNGKPVLDPYYAFEKKGLALIGRDYSLRLEGGRFFSGGAEEYLGVDLQRADGELTLTACIQPATLNQDGCVIGYGPPRGKPLFVLTQEKDALTFTLGASESRKIKLLELKSAEPLHVVLSVGKKEIVFYTNGQKTAAFPGNDDDFSAWEKGILFFGNDITGAHPWRGAIERASLYNKSLTPEEASAAAGPVLEEIRKREPVPRVEFKGTLLAQSKYPMPWDEGFTYRDVLSINEYKVNAVIQGEYKEEKIRVAEWMYVDRVFLANSQKKIGTEYKLIVERLSANPQLSTIQRGNTLELDLDAVVHYDLGSLEALPESQQPKQEKTK
jgi:hypothetical protein